MREQWLGRFPAFESTLLVYHFPSTDKFPLSIQMSHLKNSLFIFVVKIASFILSVLSLNKNRSQWKAQRVWIQERRMGEGIVRELGMDAYTLRMDNPQGPTVSHRELCSMFCGILDGRGVWGRMVTCLCMSESLCCRPKTITTLLMSYILQHKVEVLKVSFWI